MQFFSSEKYGDVTEYEKVEGENSNSALEEDGISANENLKSKTIK